MHEPLLIELPDLRLPRDFAWRRQFLAAVEEQRGRLGLPGHFAVPRFLGYYFCGRRPVVLAGRWRVTLEAAPSLRQLLEMLEQLTDPPFNLVADSEETAPDFLLVHDGHDGGCWLWEFEPGCRFVGARPPASHPGRYPAAGEEEEGRGWSRPGT